MNIITKEKIEQRISLRLIRDFDDFIWKDIVQARRSWAIVDVFIKKMGEKSSMRLLNQDAPLINALWAAAIDSVIISLEGY